MGITPLPRFGSPVSLQPPAGWLYYVRSALLRVFFPAGCRAGDRMLTEPTRIAICNECLGSFQQIIGTVCDKCGTPVEMPRLKIGAYLFAPVALAPIIAVWPSAACEADRSTMAPWSRPSSS